MYERLIGPNAALQKTICDIFCDAQRPAQPSGWHIMQKRHGASSMPVCESLLAGEVQVEYSLASFSLFGTIN